MTVIVGKKIAFFRKGRGMTQVQLAEEVNISKNHLSAVERGAKSPPLALIAEISYVLGISIEQIYKDGDE